jgi:D-beta-D-heptose 7-phosphate kinase/D-beta-D-heptose 1-phosphate adenosyltransferase
MTGWCYAKSSTFPALVTRAVSVLAMALAAGATPQEAADLANRASGIVVGKLGTATVTPEEIEATVEAA